MKSILIIIPYFGPFPKMFPFWMQSALNNPSIDFLLISDNYFKSDKNIHYVNMEFQKLQEIIKSKFEFPIVLPAPYNLCDFRGAYGHIFSNYINGYDFWGFGDIDLVYGNIRTFFTEEILNTYYVISGWGHLTLYRNNEKCNNFFKTKVPGFLYYKDVFTWPKHLGFDEYNHKGLSDMWKHLYPNLIWDSRLFDDIRVPRLSLNFFSEFHPEHSKHLIFSYNQGYLYRIYVNSNNKIVNEETLYAHFQQRGFLQIKTSNLNRYLIVPNSFIDSQDLTIYQLKKLTRPHNLQRKIRNLKTKIIRRCGIWVSYLPFLRNLIIKL